ncbi:MAG: D-alanine--D-alanine ligase [Nitrospirae bacterium]|nr:D-alanine--D-alanine ligase [Nitrospirota bacterium]
MRQELEGKKIGVLCGGLSSEREVSLRTGNAVYQCLKDAGYSVWLMDADSNISRRLTDMELDVCFIALHGGWGENGSIQGMLEIIGIPYTGSNIVTSAVAMDKLMSKYVFTCNGLLIPEYEVLRNNTEVEDISIPLPCVIKPNNEGSSVGITIVKEKSEIKEALEKAYRYCNTAIVERFIKGKEIHVGIVGGKVLGGVEIRTKREFYDYEAKYLDGATQYIIPPQIDEILFESVKDTALKAYQVLNCKGAARVDMIVIREGKSYILEVNTLPGMTATSLLPKIAMVAGLTFTQLIEDIIIDSLV